MKSLNDQRLIKFTARTLQPGPTTYPIPTDERAKSHG